MQVIKRDTPLNYEYAGNIKSTDEVKITSRVSGTIVEKYIDLFYDFKNTIDELLKVG